MKKFFFIFIAVQLALVAISVAQITFTREWVTGKRSPKVKVLLHEEDHSFCRSLIPAIDYLLEAETIRQKICGGPSAKAVPFPFVWNKPLQSNDVLNNVNAEPIEETNGFDGSLGHIRKST